MSFLHNLAERLKFFKSSTSKVVDDSSKKDTIVSKLHRIRGQVDGVERMYLHERECTDIVYQIMAIKSSLDSVAKELLTNEIVACSRTGDIDEVKKLMKEVVKS